MASASGTCANCGKQACFRCSRCQGAPNPDTGDMSSIFYCTKACQTKHWSAHRAECKARMHRMKLFRTAVILKAAFLIYRALHFDVELCKIELRGKTLYMYDNQRDLSVLSKRGPFPEHMTTNAEHREAALLWFQCMAAISMVSRLIWKLLADVPCQLEILTVNVGQSPLTTQCVPGPDSPNVPSLDSSTTPHDLILVKLLSNKELWVLDITGAQLGVRDVLVPYEKYRSILKCSICHDSPTPYDCNETYDLDVTRCFGNKCRQEMLNRERPTRQRFSSFVDGVDKHLLDGSPAEFEEKLKALKTALTLHMSTGI